MTPSVHGQLFAAGVPVANAPMRLAATEEDKYQCEGKYVEFTTDENGNFDRAAIKRFSMIMAVMAHSFHSWSVFTKPENEWLVLHSSETYTLVDTGPTFNVEINCAEVSPSPNCTAREYWP